LKSLHLRIHSRLHPTQTLYSISIYINQPKHRQHACLTICKAQVVLEHLYCVCQQTSSIPQVSHGTPEITCATIANHPDRAQYQTQPAGLLDDATANILIRQQQLITKHLEEVFTRQAHLPTPATLFFREPRCVQCHANRGRGLLRQPRQDVPGRAKMAAEMRDFTSGKDLLIDFQPYDV